MKKMPCLFLPEGNSRLASRTIRPDCNWVHDPGCLATKKWDGTACAFIDGKLYARFDAKKTPAPPGSIECGGEYDGHHRMFWTPVTDHGQYKWHMEAFKYSGVLLDGTYELVGPKVNGNPQGLARHVFMRHGDIVYTDAPRDFDGLKEYLSQLNAEGIVFSLGERRCKVRRKDFGLEWP